MPARRASEALRSAIEPFGSSLHTGNAFPGRGFLTMTMVKRCPGTRRGPGPHVLKEDHTEYQGLSIRSQARQVLMRVQMRCSVRALGRGTLSKKHVRGPLYLKGSGPYSTRCALRPVLINQCAGHTSFVHSTESPYAFQVLLATS